MTEHVATVTIVKIGGSLFELPGLAQRLLKWLEGQPSGWHVFVAGGGELAEAIRRADELHGLGEEASHWLCVDVLSVTARFLATILDDLPYVATFDDLTELLQSSETPGAVVFNPREFLHAHEAEMPGEALPRDWSATSDSIAARLAVCVAADELVLFKSVGPPPAESFHELAEQGYVDGFFPIVGRGVPSVRFVNPS